MTGPVCHEGVTRNGEYQPCERPAVAERLDRSHDTWYQVCTKHTRGKCRPLTPEPLTLIQTCAELGDLDVGTVLVAPDKNNHGEAFIWTYEKGVDAWLEAGTDSWLDDAEVHLPAVVVWPLP